MIDVPLAYLYLSAFLKRYLEGPVEIELIDLRFTGKIGPTLARRLRRFQPDLIGISLLAADKYFLNEWSDFLRTNAPEAKIVIGGVAATYEYDELLPANQAVDWAVIGEGEVVFLNLVRALMAGEHPGRINGLAYVDAGTAVCNNRADYIEDLDTIPFPDYSLVNLPDYFGSWGDSHNGFLYEKRYTPVMSSRGCPFRCIYCHDIFGKKIRKRSPANFMQELQWLYDDYGIREFHIMDDIFNIDRERMHTILQLIIESGMNVKLAFPNGLRADILKKEDLNLLKQAGAYALCFAIESASPRVQKMIRKNLNIARVSENIEYAESIGLIVRGFFMLGFPGETMAEIQSTVAFAKKSRLDLASFFTPIPFRGTALRRLVETMYPSLTYSIRGDYWYKKSFYYLTTGYDIRRANLKASLKFYSPLRVFKTFGKLPNKLHMINIVWGFLLIVFNRRTS